MKLEASTTWDRKIHTYALHFKLFFIRLKQLGLKAEIVHN